MFETYHPEIRQLAIFSTVAEGHFHDLMQAAYVQNFPQHVELITEGDPSDFLHIVLAGSVELFSSWHTRETSLATVRPVSTFILAAAVRDAPYLMSARTLEKSRIALIPSQDVRRVFGEDVEFARAVVNELADCYRAVVKNTKDLKLRTSLERLANYLLREQNRQAGAPQFALPYEKRRLASFLGMTPENLSRAFKGLRPYGVVVDGNRISITDQADLVAFAKPSPLIDDRGG
ncbi:helix-turn-helix domain-containing protein [Pseudohalocynthiibacter aestuariivivens]|uniref:Helix-turn-helix domain-containing protein n=1 Tax=Roseovarius pelagicus TaxID=2980108 RepID=A0ABY6DDV6_9RHOB|nr:MULTISPECIES: helix-turn-helix domain-containing protein [Rhodobacterales]QIE47197.1 helix-turn-helix domain-containing protein [Pseudohalocynthiibacter aestuariivivens]UXX84250.1 helix-turn-helix domain-containing protein [Roseovarius pelagicus]